MGQKMMMMIMMMIMMKIMRLEPNSETPCT